MAKESAPERTMTAGLRPPEYVIVAFTPALPRSLLEIFEEELYPYSNLFTIDDKRKSAIRGMLYHNSVFVGNQVEWDQVALQYLGAKAEAIDYSFPQKRLTHLGDASLDRLAS